MDKGSAVGGTGAVIEATVVFVVGVSSGISSEFDEEKTGSKEGSMVVTVAGA